MVLANPIEALEDHVEIRQWIAVVVELEILAHEAATMVLDISIEALEDNVEFASIAKR